MRKKKPQNIEIGKRIRDRREVLKLTRDQLAEITEISTRFLTCIETGQSGISIETLGKIAVALDISTDYLVLGRGSKDLPQDIVDEVSKIPETHQDLLRRQIRLFHDVIEKR